MLNWRALLPGVAATMMGIGFARFSFTPLSGLFVEQQIINSQNVTIIATAMMAGYFLGAVLASLIAKKFGPIQLIRLCFVVVGAGLLVEGVALDFTVFMVVRFLMNFAGACLMVVGPSMVLSHVKSDKRGLAAAVIFTGIGVGIVIAGSIVSAFANFDAVVASVILFMTAIVVLSIGWRGWHVGDVQRTENTPMTKVFSAAYVGLLFAYGFEAIAFIPHTVFLSDYVSSELSHGAQFGGYFWAIFGLGAVVGPLSILQLLKVLNGHASLVLVILSKTVAVGIVAFSTSPVLIAVSAFVVGALVPAMVVLISTRTMELVGPNGMTKAWGLMTATFAVGQFFGATGMSVAYSAFGSYQPLFGIAAIFQALGLVILIILTRYFSPALKRKLER